MTDTADVLQIWLTQAKRYVVDDDLAPIQKARLIAFNAGACWGRALSLGDPCERAKAFDMQKRISSLTDKVMR